jgi:hypothetical protein
MSDHDDARERALEENRRRSEVLANSAMRLQGSPPHRHVDPAPAPVAETASALVMGDEGVPALGAGLEEVESHEAEATPERRPEQPGE